MKSITEQFKDFLKDQKVYDDFSKEIASEHGDIDRYLNNKPHHTVMPGYYVGDAFVWAQSITKKPKDAYDFWYSIHTRWCQYISDNNIKDRSEIYERGW